MAHEATTSLLWHQTSAGRYERDVDEVELGYATLIKLFESIGRSLFAITGFVELGVEISEHDSPYEVGLRVETALRKAWRRIRYDHPNIAAPIEYDPVTKTCKRVYQTFMDGKDCITESAWLEETFKLIDNGQSGIEFCNSDPPVSKYPTLFLITPPTSEQNLKQNTLEMQVVFRSHHDIIDGIGTLVLLNNLFTHASQAYTLADDYPQVNFGDEHANLSPSFRVAADIASSPSQAQLDRLQSIKAKNEAARENVELIGIPLKSNTRPPQRSQRVCISVSVAETAALLRACKDFGISVTHAFHAGVVVAVRDLQERKDESRNGRYLNYCLVNLRGKCLPPFNSDRHPVSLYHSTSGTSLVVDVTIPSKSSVIDSVSLKSEYMSIAKEIKAFYVNVRSNPGHVNMVPLYFKSFTPPYTVEPKPPPPPSQTPSVSISSLGIIDKIIQPRHGEFTLKDPWVTGDEFGTGVGLFIGTWNKELTMSAVYNEAYHEMESVMRFLESVKKSTFDALQV